MHLLELLRTIARRPRPQSAVGVVQRGHAVGRSPVELKPGDPAPDFSLPGSDGRTYRLKDLAGRPVVIAWFPKAFTGG